MDHGLFEMEGNAMSPVHVDGFDLCDNLSNSEAQTQNLNETLAQTLPLPQNDEGGTRSPVQKPSLDNNEEETGIEGNSLGSRDVDEEEDVDEVMKEEEEEEESEASSSLICRQSPDNLMTDSSYSETGSLLETPYPFSPGTSPEPASPVIPVISPETLHPINSLELSQSGDEVISSSTGSGLDSVESATCSQAATFTTESVGLASDTRLDGSSGTRCNTLASDATLKDSCPEQRTSSKDPVSNCGPALTGVTSSSSTGPVTNREPSTFTRGSHTAESSFPTSSNQEQFTSSPSADYSSVSSTRSALSPTLLASLEQMAERDDDAHLPQYLHQIAETFVLQKDYQRALLFIQLEQLYHQRVLENLNALQEQWVSHCGGASPELAATHLDSLKHICQTHSRPRTRDAEVAVLDNMSIQFGRGVPRPPCISTHQVKGGMEQRDEDSSSPAALSDNLIKRLSSPETDRKPPNGSSRRMTYGSDQTRRQADGREGGGERAASAWGNGLHPSAAGGMDRSSPAEQQEEDLGPAREAEANEEGEEEDGSEVEEAAEALEMEDEGTEDESEEKRSEPDAHLCQEAPTVETLVSGAELHREKLHQTQEESESRLSQEALPSQEAELEQQEQYPEEREEEEDYEDDFMRRAPSLDQMAKLITVEEMSPASGLVSILKKQSVYVDRLTASADPEPSPEKPTAKRRVRFKVPDDAYDHEVGSGDSCLLLFLLCLVTVVISVGGTALYCALGDAQSSVCQDFSRNVDFYFGQLRRGMTRLQHWCSSGL